MNSNYTGLWLLLSVSFFVVIMFALSTDVTLDDWNVKKAPLREALLAERYVETDIVAEPDSIAVAELAEEVAVLDTVPKNILLFGDSMTLNLAFRISKYAEQNGHSFHALSWDASNTKLWAEADTLPTYLARFKPDFIMIALGSNEVYFKDPSKRLPYVKKILSMVGDRPYVWIGPPDLFQPTAINDMLEATCRRGSYFRSDGIKMARQKDKIHPTRGAAAVWADSIMRWVATSAHPILADTPADSVAGRTKDIIIMKAVN